MKCITVCQPYAHLIAIGEKLVENRTWPTRYRGSLLIHAGLSRDWLHTYRRIKEPMAYGAVVAIAQLVDCLPINEIQAGLHDMAYPWLREHEHASGPYCFLLADVKRLEVPMPIRGRQGLYDVDWPLAA